jgi:hypothetical protein
LFDVKERGFSINLVFTTNKERGNLNTLVSPTTKERYIRKDLACQLKDLAGE